MVSYKIISIGLGVQSTTLYLMSSIGEIERADYAVFADTGKEFSPTYETLKWLENWQKENNGIEIIVRRKKNLYNDLMNGSSNRFASIPAYTLNKDKTIGMLRRQCTSEYKIQEINKVILDLYGLKKGQRRLLTDVCLGITTDEAHRMRDSKEKWKINKYPLIDLRINRNDCVAWLTKKEYPVPEKSACVFCPYQSDFKWKMMKKKYPEDFKSAVEVDKSIRNSIKKGVKNPIFLHKTAKPLDEVDFSENQLDLFANECEGICNT